jgi:hypothetical protein
VFLLDTALDAVLEVVVAGVIDVGSYAMAVERRGSGCELRGWGRRWSAVGQLGSECHRSGGPGSGSAAGQDPVVVVVDVVVNVDVACGGCANIVNGAMAGNSGSGGSVMTLLWVV